MAKYQPNCELCNAEAMLYCASDSAYLCWNCDYKVHHANFLVARHIRSTLCSVCGNSDGNRFSGVGFRPIRTICRSCSPEIHDDDWLSSSSSSSACISTTESSAIGLKPASNRRRKASVNVSGTSEIEFSGEESNAPASLKRRRERTARFPVPAGVNSKVEGILVNWCRRLGLETGRVVPLTVDVYESAFSELTLLPFRVTLTASFWIGLKLCGTRRPTCQDLRRVEEISGVPAKLILATEAKLARVLKRRRGALELEEGWAECSA